MDNEDLKNLGFALDDNTQAVYKLTENIDKLLLALAGNSAEKPVIPKINLLQPIPENRANRPKEKEVITREQLKHAQGKIVELMSVYCNTLYANQKQASSKAQELVISHMRETANCSRLDAIPVDKFDKFLALLDEQINAGKKD